MDPGLASIAAAAIAGLFGLMGIIIGKLNTIHTLANSNLASINARLETANAEIGGLKALIAEMREPSRSHSTAPPTGEIAIEDVESIKVKG